ncbi:phytyl ester synthase 1, chloroplastic isoform X1 [Lactuca sativa]|uniref:phytyl ester synthase 1, chloroplastic isoform X1 n=1 Tax=Lactuca sativa TaxID=4236 RepID=UPI0022AEFD58|nr:phytyl ester synthase 1, chloroplastic isoform X1 [Lactuca sativa]
MFVEATTSVVNLSPCFALKSGYYKNPSSRVSVKCTKTASDSSLEKSANLVKGVSLNKRVGSLNDVERREILGSNVIDDKSRWKEEKLEPLWDDGYGTQSVKDYLDLAKDIIKPDGGPPRWFCPVVADGNECPLPNSPVLLFLPGIDGLGLGLILHHKSLKKVFEVRCLHIPIQDRTPFEGLLTIVEDTLRFEHDLFPNRPIYLVGDSFGGCLALAVAARNPTIDLVVIVSNPSTSFDRSQLRLMFSVLEVMPSTLHVTIPYILSFVMGNPIKMAMVTTEASPTPNVRKVADNLTMLLPRLSGLSDIIPRSTLLWKLKLLKSSVAYTNSRLHDVKAEVLVLASGKDNMFPSSNEAQRLSKTLQNSKIYYFKDNGHALLLEDGINLLTILKQSLKYRRTCKHDVVKDYLPPSMSEYKNALAGHMWFQFATSPVMFSTLEDGRIVRGLSGIPDEGPVLLVGYHMLMGLELAPLIIEFLREKNVIVRGLAHPELFTSNFINEFLKFSYVDLMKVFGALPVTPTNLFKLLSTKSFVLLYPGGAREALHRKGEQYKLFWPDKQEFVRMAAKFRATIVPFGTIGEDDITELVLDNDDMMKIPILNDQIKKANEEAINVRAGVDGEVGNQNLFFPVCVPKVPGRFYYLFGKPITTKGKEKILKDRENAKELYMEIKSEVEKNMTYLIKKREEDPYRGVVNRLVNQPLLTPVHQVPTFEP